MKTKQNYILKKVGSGFVVVTVGEASREFNGMIRLNEPGAFLWKLLVDGANRQQLLDAMMERYDDLDLDTAQADLAEFLETVGFALDGFEE